MTRDSSVHDYRIPLSPPYSLQCREIRLDCSGNCEKSALFGDSSFETGPEKVRWLSVSASFAAFFSAGHGSSPVSAKQTGECNAFINRRCGEVPLTFGGLAKLLVPSCKWLPLNLLQADFWPGIISGSPLTQA